MSRDIHFLCSQTSIKFFQVHLSQEASTYAQNFDQFVLHQNHDRSRLVLSEYFETLESISKMEAKTEEIG